MKKVFGIILSTLTMVVVIVSCKPNVPAETLKMVTDTIVYVDSTIQLKATPFPENATGTIVWSSNNSDVAKVNESGQVIGVKAGEAIITAVLGTAVASCKTTIKNNPVSLELSLVDVAQKKCTVAVTASDTTGYYYCGYAPKASVASLDDKTIETTILKSLETTLAAYQKYYPTLTLKDFLQKGSGKLTASGLTASTEYTMFAFGIDTDTKKMSPKVARLDFTTKAVVPSSNTFTIAFDGIGSGTKNDTVFFKITPSNNDKYLAGGLTRQLLDSLYEGSDKVYMEAMETYYDKNYSSYGGTDAATMSGEKRIYFKNPTVGSVLHLIVAGYNGGFTTDFTSYEYTYQGAGAPQRVAAKTRSIGIAEEVVTIPFVPYIEGSAYKIE